MTIFQHVGFNPLANLLSMLDITTNTLIQTLPDGTTFEMIPVEGYTLSGFYMAKYPVTQNLYKVVMKGENPSYFKGDNRPVEQVSWFDAVIFCNVLNEVYGYQQCYFSDENYQKPYGKADNTEALDFQNAGDVFRKHDAQGYRLPTQFEWKFAACGGNKSGNFKYSGSDKLNEIGWYRENSHGQTKPVGLKLGNELDIYDMTGNVWEWCEDCEYVIDAIRNPLGYCVMLGGGWSDDGQILRPTCHHHYDSLVGSYSNRGFRIILSPL